MHRYRTHSCAQLRMGDVGTQVRLSGWVHRVRDHGGVLFVDLRDHYGVTQLVAGPESPVFDRIKGLRPESCICVDGEVCLRPEDTVNERLETGAVEVALRDLEILGSAAELPLQVFGEPEYPEDTRLRYRFLDLRRETMHRNMMLRIAVISAMRARMEAGGFREFTTPILTVSSPEGARDFLVPSRLHAGRFYALPQAPQQFKQMLMVAGFDRYFQIAPCFRDEDPRADRLPGEFYQLDVEMSFVTQDDVLETMEEVLRGIFEDFGGEKKVTCKFPRIMYADAIRRYGTDKPDLRNPIIMKEVTESFRHSGFLVFANAIAQDSDIEVWAIPARTGGKRAFCDRMNDWAQGMGQAGLGYIFWRDENGYCSGSGPIARNIGSEATEALREQLGLGIGDACFFICGRPSDISGFAGSARTYIGAELGLIAEDQFALCWITDYPMFEWNDQEKCLDFMHNPFSMPQGGLEALMHEDPLSIKAHQYDLVCNGYEIASGAIRNHDLKIMERVFGIAGYEEDQLKSWFGGLYRAFQYGAPPHGGMAAGIDRIVMLICGADNVRDITLFPMNQQACDPLMGAPGVVEAEQLRTLHVQVSMPRS